ncbi:MAG: diguanylate cyclase [Actinobacteria bacterium]|nr:diguanylate cyclase [Actinomycetota bacterium]
MDIEKITKTQLIEKLIDQHQKIQQLEEKSEKEIEHLKKACIENKGRFESILSTSSIGILTMSRNGVITECNDGILNFAECKREDLVGKYFTKRISVSTGDIPHYIQVFTDVLAGEEAHPFEVSQRHKDGSVLYGEVYFGPVKDGDGNITGFKIIIKDITEKKMLQESLKEAEDKFLLFIESSMDAVVLHLNGKILKVNKSFMELFNCTPDYLESKNLMDFISPDYRTSFTGNMESDYPGVCEICGLKSSGSRVYMESVGRWIVFRGRKARMEIFHDISELKKSEKRIRYLKFHDSLTELYNRTYMEKVLENVYRARHMPLNFIICDLNGLKVVNDTFGYVEGDLLLKRFARILRYCIRKEDIVARWGGDEFFILLPRSSTEEVDQVANKIRNICINTKDQKIPLNISMGIATRNNPEQDFRELIGEAENNMYTNKLLERKSTYSSIIASLERILWEKSQETKEHAERLKVLILKLGKAISLPQNKLDELVLLSTLHDIGKVAVPEKILMKKGKLTREEWKIIKRHPEIGYNIAKSTPQIAMIAEDILSHHEWWDGSGYPQGLRGVDIPINSLITSIVDAYDVMTVGRTYREPINKKDASDELRRCAGTQFSPLLVDKFVRIA